MLRFIIPPLFFVSTLCVSQPASQFPREDGKVTFAQVFTLDSSFNENVIYSLVSDFIAANNKAFNRYNGENNASMKDALWGVQKKGSENVDLLFKNDNPLKIDKKDERLTAKGVYKYTGRDKLSSALRLMFVEYMVNIYIKHGRFKIEITDFNYTHYDHRTMKQVQIGTMKNEGPCSSKGQLESLLLCDKAKGDFAVFYPSLNSEMQTFIKELSMHVFSGKRQSKKMDF